MPVSYESVRAAIIFILGIWKLSDRQDEVLRMLGLPLAEPSNGNEKKRFTACRLKVSVKELGEAEAVALGAIPPTYEISQKGSSVKYLFWRQTIKDMRGREKLILRAKRRDELEAEKKTQQGHLL